MRKHYLAEDHPDDVHHKYYLLKHFEEYMFQRLNGGQDFCFEDLGRTKNLDFVQKYFRMKNVIVFRLSHEVIQVRHHVGVQSRLPADFLSSSTSSTTPKSS